MTDCSVVTVLALVSLTKKRFGHYAMKNLSLRSPSAMRGCLKNATTMRPDGIFLLLHCGAKPQHHGLVLACFSFLCNLNAISLSRVAFHLEFENHAVSSPPLKLPVQGFGNLSVKS